MVVPVLFLRANIFMAIHQRLEQVSGLREARCSRAGRDPVRVYRRGSVELNRIKSVELLDVQPPPYASPQSSSPGNPQIKAV